MSKVKKVDTSHMSAMELKEHRLSVVYKVLPIISICLLIGLWLVASNAGTGFPSPIEVWERTVRLFTKPIKKLTLIGHVLVSLRRIGLALLFDWTFGIALGIVLGWFPAFGAYANDLLPSAGMVYYMSVFRHWQLPFMTTVILMIGGQAIGMRSMSLYELNVDYVLYSKLLGVRDSKITMYVFKNAILPQISGLALSLGSMVGGALITETIFSYPGIGLSLMKAIRRTSCIVHHRAIKLQTPLQSRSQAVYSQQDACLKAP